MNVNEFVEIHIILTTIKDQRRVITKLWQSFLKDDQEFHFLYEPGYLLLRFDRKNLNTYCKELNRRHWKYKYYSEWIEADSKTVNHYKEFFASYFHLISTFILSHNHDLTFNDKEYYAEDNVLERIAHCYYNISNSKIREQNLYAYFAISRAYMNGFYVGKLNSHENK
jgi:hypothetical protein